MRMIKIWLFAGMFAIGGSVFAHEGCNGKCTTQNTCDKGHRAAIYSTPERAGGMYFAYPFTTDSLAPVPDGYEPVYISHYGRHGSRYVLSTKYHPRLLKLLEPQEKIDNLTEKGKNMLRVVRKSEAVTEGHIGELSRLGTRQHKAIAARMYKRFPSLFEDGDTVQARSSMVQRCIMSMAAFSEGLKENNPKLTVLRHASPKDMDIIIYKTPCAQRLEDSDSIWRVGSQPLIDSLQRSESSARQLFKDISKVENLGTMMNYIREIATSLQNVEEIGENIMDVFEPEDLYNQWLVSNYRLYVRHGNAVLTDGCGPKSSVNLVRDFVNKANESLAGNGVSADLRFGHDTGLLKLIAFLGVKGADARAAGIRNVAEVWHGDELTPMAGNLQMILFKDKKGKVLAGFRLHEQPVLLNGIEESTVAPGYYDWQKLSDHLLKICDDVK